MMVVRRLFLGLLVALSEVPSAHAQSMGNTWRLAPRAAKKTHVPDVALAADGRGMRSDFDAEGDETFSLLLTDVTDAAIANGEGRALIIDDEPAAQP